MSAPFPCSTCAAGFWSRTELDAHETMHDRERPRYYRAKLAKGAPYVGLKVWHGAPLVDGEELDRSERLQCLVDTETTARAVLQVGDDGVPVEVDGLTIRNIELVVEAEYRFLLADAQHAQEWRPDSPKASPRRRVDWSNLKVF